MRKNLMLCLAAVSAMVSCQKQGEMAQQQQSAEPTATRQTTAFVTCRPNPVIPGEYSGDTFCLKYDANTYYMYRPEGKRVVVNQSSDLVNWTDSVSLKKTSTTTFASGSNVWAPEVHSIGGVLYMIYALPNGTGGGRDIMMCKMDSPTMVGSANTPFMLVGATAAVNIDPTIYAETNSGVTSTYLVWKYKVDDSSASQIVIQKLSTSGTPALTGTRSTLLPDAVGNPTNKEHPTLLREDNSSGQWRYFLMFNTHIGNTQYYDIEYATSNTLTGTYTYQQAIDVNRASHGIYGVGAQSVVRDGGNLRWIVYRAKQTTTDGWNDRLPCADRLQVDATANTITATLTKGPSARPTCPQ